jgi:hypothetical protein
MALKALHDSLSRTVWRIMATAAFWHDLRIIVTQGVIGMKYLMTFSASNALMPGTVVTQPVIMGCMATPTFLKRQWRDFHCVDIISCLFCGRCTLRCKCKQQTCKQGYSD